MMRAGFFENDRKISGAQCLVDLKTLGFTIADFEVTQQLGEFFRKLMPQNADQIFSLGSTNL